MLITRSHYPNPAYYVSQWRLAKRYAQECPTQTVVVDRWLYSTARHEYDKFIAAMNRRINSRGNLCQSGRRMSDEYQNALRGDVQDLREKLTQRIRIYQFRTDIMRKRFGHILDSYSD